jgi:hypothetical protein
MVKSKREIRGVTIVSNLPFDDNEETQHDASVTEAPPLSSTTTNSTDKSRSSRNRTESKNDVVVEDLDSAHFADDDDDNDSQADDSATISAADAGSGDCGTATTLDSVVEPSRPLHFKDADCWPPSAASPVPHESASQRLPDTPSSLLRRDSPSSHKRVASSEVCLHCAHALCQCPCVLSQHFLQKLATGG